MNLKTPKKQQENISICSHCLGYEFEHSLPCGSKISIVLFSLRILFDNRITTDVLYSHQYMQQNQGAYKRY